MVELIKLARPYAQAAFEYARDNKQFSQWTTFLSLSAAITHDPMVAKLLANPTCVIEKKQGLYKEVLKDQLNDAQLSFLKLLAINNRLAALPEIFNLYERYREGIEGIFDVKVTSAVPLDEKFKQSLVVKLQKTFGKQATLTCDIDQSLIGGLLIRAGDKVIDGSVRGQFVRLKAALMG